jgi:hypothetical protein
LNLEHGDLVLHRRLPDLHLETRRRAWLVDPPVIAKELQTQGRSFEERFGKYIDRMPRARASVTATVHVFGGMADHSPSLFIRLPDSR